MTTNTTKPSLDLNAKEISRVKPIALIPMVLDWALGHVNANTIPCEVKKVNK